MTPWQMPLLNDQEFGRIRRLLYETTGIALNDTKKPLVSSRLMNRLRHLEIQSFSAYYQLVKADPDECQVMTDLLTTNETRFFREEAHFTFLRKELESPQSKRSLPFRAWSAACSSGEEPYTIAMVCAEVLGMEGQFEVLGSDISQRVLDRARTGVYTMDRAASVPPAMLKKYCMKGVRTNEGKFCVVRRLRDHVTFKQINLLSPPVDTGGFDFIFLRNVMIYFDNATRKQIVDRMIGSLKVGGYFVIGTAESLIGVTDTLESADSHVYRRRQ